MLYSVIRDLLISRYDVLQTNKCFCLDKSMEEWHFLRKVLFSSTSPDEDKKEDCQLLFMSVFQLCARIYVEEVNQNRPVCQEIKGCFAFISGEDMLFSLTEDLTKTSNKYLRWATAKALSAIMNGVELPVLENWMHSVIAKLQFSDDTTSLYIIELLVILIRDGIKPISFENPSMCKNMVCCPAQPIKDIKSCIYRILSKYWMKLVQLFTKKASGDVGEQKLIEFLNLWKLLIENPSGETEFPVFLDKQFVLDFLSHSSILKSRAVVLYVDLIIQILYSSLKYKLCEARSLAEVSVSRALFSGLLESLPTKEEGFCDVQNRTSSEFLNMTISDEEVKLNLTAKRVIFILLNLSNEFQNIQLLCEVLEKVLKFIPRKNCLDGGIAFKVINAYTDEDDLLFAVMLALLRIYIKLKKEEKLRNEQHGMVNVLLHELNPHVIFLQLLRLLGYDHNELLSFLVSDETCCLLYLLEYLKLFLQEQYPFFNAFCQVSFYKNMPYRNLFRKRNVSVLPNPNCANFCERTAENISFNKKCNASTSDTSEQLVKFEDSCNKTADCNADKNILLEKESGETGCSNRQLVEYSSSEEDSEKECDFENQASVLNAISVLKNLKIAIQKLIDLEEFPYNVLPLLSLLNAAVESAGRSLPLESGKTRSFEISGNLRDFPD